MSSIVKTTEDRISELQDKTREFIQFQQKKRKHTEKKINSASGTCGKITKEPTFLSSEFQEERRKKVGLKEHVKK